MKLLHLATALASSVGVANAFMGLRVPHANPAGVAGPRSDQTQMSYSSGFYSPPTTTNLPQSASAPPAVLDNRVAAMAENAADNSQIGESAEQIAAMTNAIATMTKQIADMNKQIADMSNVAPVPVSAAPDAVVRTAVAAARPAMSPVGVSV